MNGRIITVGLIIFIVLFIVFIVIEFMISSFNDSSSRRHRIFGNTTLKEGLPGDMMKKLNTTLNNSTITSQQPVSTTSMFNQQKSISIPQIQTTLSSMFKPQIPTSIPPTQTTLSMIKPQIQIPTSIILSSTNIQTPPDYATKINKNLSSIEAIIRIIESKIEVFNQNSSDGTNTIAKLTTIKETTEEIDINLDTDSIDTINTRLTNYISVNKYNTTKYKDMVSVLNEEVKNIRNMKTTNSVAYDRSVKTFNLSKKYINELNQLSPSKTSPAIIFEDEILNLLGNNFNLKPHDKLQSIEGLTEGLEVTPSNVQTITKIASNNILLFEQNGILIDRKMFDKVNDELNKFIKESVGNAPFTKSIFVEQCAIPLKKNNIVTSANLVDTISALSTYGYNTNKSIFFYLQKFNALNIILNTPAYNALLAKYNKYGNITDLETFLNKCAELKIIENVDGTQTEFSYEYFMIKHAHLGITTNTQLIEYINRLNGFYTALNKEKYTLFLDMVNSFHVNNPIVRITSPNNKLDEFIKILRETGINTYDEYITIFQYETDNSTIIKSGNVNVKLTSIDVYTFMNIFKTYYNKYRYPPKSFINSPPSGTETLPEPSVLFAEKYPAINQNTIPSISLTQSIRVFLSTFRELQFTQNGCFGYFIKSLINGPKYMLNLLDVNPVDEPNPILYNYYIQTTTNGFSTMNSTTDSYYVVFQRMISPFTQLFWNTHTETFNPESSTTTGYLNALKESGVTDTNAIAISPTKTVNDREFLTILIDSITPYSDSGSVQVNGQSMIKAVELLSFFGSLQLPVHQFDRVLKSIKRFGVTTTNLTNFTGQIGDFKLGSYDNFNTFLDIMVKLNVSMDALSNFKRDLVNFGFDRTNDPQNKMIDYLFFTLNILIQYDITYNYQYDTRYTKISNCLYNLSLDGIKISFFGDKQNNVAIQLLKNINRDLDLYGSNVTVDKAQLNKNMRDFIIRRSEFFYNSSDTTTFGKYYNHSIVTTDPPATLPSFPKDLYGKLFESSALPQFMYELDEKYPTTITPLFNGNPIQQQNNSDPMEMKRMMFYKYIVAQIPYENVNIPLPFDYCKIANLLTVNEYDQMLRTDGSVLVIRSVMSRLLNKLLINQDVYNPKNKSFTGNAQTMVSQYNSFVDTINMIRIFPHYSFYLIAKHIREKNPRESDPTKCGDPKYRAHDGTINPYVIELSTTNTPDTTKYSYTEQYSGLNNTRADYNTPDNSFDFYNVTKPFMSSSQYATW